MSNLLISLELQGYKTFASKTEFKFPAPLTAIVGPNGSGKSNIADSIRWVLGEQAYSLLRGKKTIDMIFSGSEQRARASMASASITFDNSTGWLPIDFSEVNLTRRAYRNGENEYLINNQKVRLREINELLASSGLAERNYTIIGQGLVDSALSLKPEERRSFFEEAAGIGLYRSRRSEANQKLEKTLRNVERINDIVSELKPRLRSLEKQQEKSSSYQQIDADLKLLLKDWYGYHWHRTQESLREAIKVNAAQQEKVNQTRMERQKLEAQLEQTQRTLGQKREKVSALHRQLSALHIKKEENARQIAVLEEREQSHKGQTIELQRDLDLDQTQISSMENEIQELVYQHENSAEELKRMENDLRDAEGKLKHRISRRSEIEKQIYDHEQTINRSTQEILRLKTLIEGLEKQVAIRASDILKIEDRKKLNRSHYQDQQARLAETQKKLDSIKAATQADREKRTAISTQLSDIKTKIEEYKNDKQKCESLLQKLQGQYRLIEEAEQSLVGFSSGAKSIIDAAKKGSLHGDFRLLIDILDIPEKYELAIASALGSVVEGIVLDSNEEMSAAIDFINRVKAPRTVLINKGMLQTSDRQLTRKGSLTSAAAVISSVGDPRGIISNLLSTVYIADTMQTAKMEVRDLPPGYRVVTLEGAVFSTDGTVTVGKETRTKNFARKREKLTISAEVASTEGTLGEIAESLRALVASQQEKETALAQVNTSINQKEGAQNKLSLAIHKLEIEQAQRQEQITSEEARLSRFLAENEKEKADVSALKQKVGDLEKQVSSEKVALEALYQQLHALLVEDLRGMVMSMNSKLAVAQKMVETNEARLAEKRSLFETYQRQSLEESERIEALRSSLKQIDEKLVGIRSQDRAVNAEIAALTAENQPLENQVEKEITDQSAFLEEVDAARQRFAIAERHKMQASLKVEKLRERLERYQQKIGEDFGIFIGEDESIFGPKPLPIEGIVSQLPMLKELPEDISDQISQKKSLLRRLGPVNPNAQQEYKEVSERFNFLTEQLADLDKAEQDLRKIVEELDVLMRREFLKTFKKVAAEFENIFAQLFNGGSARLVIEDEENVLDSGIDIEATLPGRRKQELALLSGGERSLTAVALIFALLKISPTPFCILDEIDAMLDESNVMRVGEMLKELCETTQFIIITHNRNTVQLADIIYGVTMGNDSVSQVISLKLDELTDEMVH